MDMFPLPRIEDTLDLLGKSKYFTTPDVRLGYWQVLMDKKSQEKTVFVTYVLWPVRVHGHVFWALYTPATFQRLMETVLAGLVGKCCMVYLDDIITFGETPEEHLGYLQKVFDQLEKASLRLHPSKCKFVHLNVDYLGYHVSVYGLSADPKKVAAITEFPQPSDLKSLRSFLGLVSYYRRFNPCFSKVPKPVHCTY